MAEEQYFATESGTLHFNQNANQDDSDLKFKKSIKNILILIKDFYGSDTCIFYWFNSYKKNFKLLSSTDTPDNLFYKEKFPVGLDPISKICLNKESGIFNLSSDESKAKTSYYKSDYNYNSLIAHSVSVDEEVIGVIFCESRIPEFFGDPNLHTLRVFTEVIANYIRLYSLQEDFESEDNNLKAIASNNIIHTEEIFELIKATLLRLLPVVNISIVSHTGDSFNIKKMYETTDDIIKSIEGIIIESESLTSRALNNKKVFLHSFRRGDTKEFRYNIQESINIDINFCVIPILLENRCLGALCFDTSCDIETVQKNLVKIYKSVYPLFLYKSVLEIKPDHTVYNDEGQVYNKKFFIKRLNSEIYKSIQLADSTLYTVLISIDKSEENIENTEERDKLRNYFLDELKKLLANYDQIYLIDDNILGLIINASNDDKIYIELEKVRKQVSAKIFKIENKDITITISMACKKYDDFNISQGKYLEELNGMLKAAELEGGDIVKI